MQVQWPNTQSHYSVIGSGTIQILDNQWENFQSPKSREQIALQEQIIQDFLHDIYQPLVKETCYSEYLGKQIVGQNIALAECIHRISQDRLKDNVPNFTLIGAHYRSTISVKGRRSSMIADRENLYEMLSSVIGKEECSRLKTNSTRYRISLDLWQAVFLDQYFKLFGKPTTMNEWVLEQLQGNLKKTLGDPFRNRRIGVLIDFNTAEATCKILNTHDFYWICIAFPQQLCRTLFDLSACRTFYDAVTRSVNQVLRLNPKKARSALKSLDSGGPTEQEMYDWFDLLRNANLLARGALERSSLSQVCDLRNSFIAGKLLHGEGELKKFGEGLLQNFAPVTPPNGAESHRDEIGTFDRLKEVVRVFQAMLSYCTLYGDLFLTFPFFPREPAPGCSLTFMKNRKEIHGNGLTWMTDHAEALSNLGSDIFYNIMTHAVKCSREAEEGIHLAEGDIKMSWPNNTEVKKISSQVKCAEITKGERLKFIMALAMNLASARHEGTPLSFSFLLGTPNNLVHDLEIEHEFFMREHRLKLGPNKLDVAFSISLIEGNYAFLQDPELALFISYPGFPMEITHIVRLRSALGQHGSNRAMLRQATHHKNGILGAVSYGNGRADLFYDGKMIGSYSSKEWRKSNSYEEFWKNLELEIKKLLDCNNRTMEILKSTIERISDQPGHGALLAIGSEKAVKAVRDQGTPLTNVFDSVEKRTVEEVGEDLLVQVATQDGATLITGKKGGVSGRWMVRAINPQQYPLKDIKKTLVEAWKDPKGSYAWENWHKTLKWGTRRLGALGASLALGDGGLVVVISQDGPIHVLKKGKALAIGKADLIYGE